MENNNRKRFLNCVRKIDITNIVLKYIERDIYSGMIFLIRKKNIL